MIIYIVQSYIKKMRDIKTEKAQKQDCDDITATKFHITTLHT